jgi:CheY-like chemotaxis protein
MAESNKGLLMALPDEVAVPTRRVLLVEDEALVAMIAVDSLSELGYIVVEVGTARAALELAYPDCAAFDFAVIDMGLPDRPGDHLVVELRKIRPNLPIIVASGYGESEVRRRFEADERFAFLNKPYERTSLRAAIDSLGLADPSGEPNG